MLSHLPRRVAAAIKLSAIKSLVLTLRHKLEDDIAIQLKHYDFTGVEQGGVDVVRYVLRKSGGYGMPPYQVGLP